MEIFQFLAPLVIGCISGLVAGWLTLKSRLDRLEGASKEREEARKEWRQGIEARLNAHSERFQAMSSHEPRIQHLESEVSNLRQHWHKLRDGTLQDAMKLFESWKDEMVSKFQPRK